MLIIVLLLRTIMTTMVKAAKVVTVDALARAKVRDALARAKAISVQIAFQVSASPKEKAKAKVRDAQEKAKAKANVDPLATEKASAITSVLVHKPKRVLVPLCHTADYALSEVETLIIFARSAIPSYSQVAD